MNYASKGKLIAVDGRIQTGSYTNKDNVKVYTTDVVADKVQVLEWNDKKETTKNDEWSDAKEESFPWDND